MAWPRSSTPRKEYCARSMLASAICQFLLQPSVRKQREGKTGIAWRWAQLFGPFDI